MSWKKSSRSNGNGGNNCVEVYSISWNKSSRSNPSGNCVEVAKGTNEILVRDTKDKGNGPVLKFTKAEWQAFLEGVNLGEFDI